MARERIGDSSVVPEGEVRVVTCAGGRQVALCNVGGDFYAIDDLCSHDQGPLGEGTLRNGNVICPRHGAAFDPQTGKALTLPAIRPVNTYVVTVEDGEVYIDCEASA